MISGFTKRQSGFTIVELLIVIVVIGILAAITIVAYNGIQSRANDAAVQSDIKNLAKQFELFKVDKGVYPAGDTDLASIKVKVTKSAYGNGFLSGIHNFLYCRIAADGPDKYALIAASKSGTVLTYKSTTSSFTSSAAWTDTTGSIGNCQGAGINQTIGTDRDIFYYNGGWMSYVGG